MDGVLSTVIQLLWVCCFTAIDHVAAAELIETTFTRLTKVSPSGAANVSDTRRSKLDCAMSCDRGSNCLTFTFDKKTKMCYRSVGLVHDIGYTMYINGILKSSSTKPTNTATTSADLYTTNTATSAVPATVNPADLCTPDGYTYYPTENICLKLYTPKEYQVVNKANCEADGAHLLLIKDVSMHSFIKTVLNNLNSDDVFIDGEDPEKDGNFVTWNGTALPYIKWKSGDPDFEPCMRLSASSGFDFGDEECSILYKHGCVCEKDIP